MSWARPSAAVRRSALSDSIFARLASKTLRLASFARSASLLGNRKLRAKPFLTVTTSPIPPSFSIRSSRMTSIEPPSLLHAVGEQSDVASALDRFRQLALVLGLHLGDPRRHALPAIRQVTLKPPDVLVINDRTE